MSLPNPWLVELQPGLTFNFEWTQSQKTILKTWVATHERNNFEHLSPKCAFHASNCSKRSSSSYISNTYASFLLCLFHELPFRQSAGLFFQCFVVFIVSSIPIVSFLTAILDIILARELGQFANFIHRGSILVFFCNICLYIWLIHIIVVPFLALHKNWTLKVINSYSLTYIGQMYNIWASLCFSLSAIEMCSRKSLVSFTACIQSI